MNTDVTNAPLVLPERLRVVEVGQGFSVQRHPPGKRNPSALQRGGFLLVSTGGSIFVSANVNGQALQLFGALDTQSQLFCRQIPIPSKTNEIPSLKELLRDLDLRGTLVSADALLSR